MHASTTEPPITAERYHALDAFRASAMLMGIVLHAAWMLAPMAGISPPIIDRAAHPFFSYLFYLIHIFRMPGFFLIAGFFAHLVVDRRGTGAFVRQRLQRIALPLVLGWVILWPAVFFCYQWAALRSGTYFAPYPAWMVFVGVHTDWDLFRASYMLVHLWFLNVLLWLSAATLLLIWGWKRFGDRSGRLAARLADHLARWMRTPLGIPLLAVAITPLLYHGQWLGITTPFKLVPYPATFLSYWLFFLVGWLFYARLDLLRECDRRWRPRLLLGLALSITLFLYYGQHKGEGRLTDRQIYPLLAGNEIQRWPELRARLLEEGRSETPSVARNLWRTLPEPARDFIQRAKTIGDHDKNSLGRLFSQAVLPAANLAEDVALDRDGLPGDLAALLDQPEASRDWMLVNRKLLEHAFPGMIMPADHHLPEVKARKAIYSLAYALSTWWLILGSLGFFRRYLSHPSRAWQYAADSSYWLYLVHLPVLFVIEIPMASLDWPVWIKFSLLILLAVAVLVPSYHFLVRSTFIGATLNGRRK